MEWRVCRAGRGSGWGWGKRVRSAPSVVSSFCPPALQLHTNRKNCVTVCLFHPSSKHVKKFANNKYIYIYIYIWIKPTRAIDAISYSSPTPTDLLKKTNPTPTYLAVCSQPGVLASSYSWRFLNLPQVWSGIKSKQVSGRSVGGAKPLWGCGH